MSKIYHFCKGLQKYLLELINEILLFQYSCGYISAKRGNYRIIYSALERVWVAVYCVQVSKSQLLFGPRNSPLNIQTIEFC